MLVQNQHEQAGLLGFSLINQQTEPETEKHWGRSSGRCDGVGAIWLVCVGPSKLFQMVSNLSG